MIVRLVEKQIERSFYNWMVDDYLWDIGTEYSLRAILMRAGRENRSYELAVYLYPQGQYRGFDLDSRVTPYHTYDEAVAAFDKVIADPVTVLIGLIL